MSSFDKGFLNLVFKFKILFDPRKFHFDPRNFYFDPRKFYFDPRTHATHDAPTYPRNPRNLADSRNRNRVKSLKTWETS